MNQTGPQHQATIHVRARCESVNEIENTFIEITKVGEQEIGYGRGNSIRVAKREAAVEALQYLRASPGRVPAAEDSSGARESDGRARNDSNSA
jgi:Double-stranded RNA binding motif